jgi:hypothetical protein
MEQTERDVALTLQRDYRTFNLKKTTELSNRVPIYTGYLSTGANAYPNISWSPGSEVDAAFNVLETLLTQLSKGQNLTAPPKNRANPGVWPVDTINSTNLGWPWIRSLYAFVNPAYAQWLSDNNITYPAWV